MLEAYVIAFIVAAILFVAGAALILVSYLTAPRVKEGRVVGISGNIDGTPRIEVGAAHEWSGHQEAHFTFQESR